MFRCRICGSQNYTEVLAGLNSKFSLKKCGNCSFVSIDPLPAAEELKQHYSPTYWQENQGVVGKALGLFYRFRMMSVVRDIKKLTPKKGRILDWGAGDGSLIKILSKKGFDCFGIDLYQTNPEDKRIINASIENLALTAGSFDAITCFHTLEHLPNPLFSLKWAAKLLKRKGLLIIEVPNIASLGFKVFKKKWQPLEIPLHLNHFSPKFLKKILTISGELEIIKFSFFSHRASPGAIILSLFPFFSPNRVRAKHQGKYPLFLMVFYLVLQCFAYPLAAFGSFLKQGSIMRVIARKQ